jgi:hypothetical protein
MRTNFHSTALQLLERKATILEQKIIQTAEAKQLEATNDGLAKLQARYLRPSALNLNWCHATSSWAYLFRLIKLLSS